MKVKGQKEVKKGARLYLKKLKIDEKIQKLRKQYHEEVSIPDVDCYFENAIKSIATKHFNKN